MEKFMYSCENDGEVPLYDTINEAVEMFIDQVPEPVEGVGAIDVHIFKPKPFTRKGVRPLVDDLLEDVVYRMDQEWWFCDDGGSGFYQESDEMEAVATLLTEVLFNSYEPNWWEDCGAVVKVDGRKWIEQNRPEWLGDAVADEDNAIFE